jgi:hypothetical protein
LPVSDSSPKLLCIASQLPLALAKLNYPLKRDIPYTFHAWSDAPHFCIKQMAIIMSIFGSQTVLCLADSAVDSPEWSELFIPRARVSHELDSFQL